MNLEECVPDEVVNLQCVAGELDPWTGLVSLYAQLPVRVVEVRANGFVLVVPLEWEHEGGIDSNDHMMIVHPSDLSRRVP